MVEEDTSEVETTPLEEASDEASEPVSKKDSLKARLADAEESVKKEKSRAEDLFKRLQYLQADLENFRRRTEKDVSDARRFGNERLLSDLLVVNDEMELALAKAREAGENPVFLEGVEMVLKRLSGILFKEGVERIAGVGTMFNPELQEAISRVPSNEEDGTIVEEIRSGYTLKGRILRPSIVKVAEKTPKEEVSEENSES